MYRFSGCQLTLAELDSQHGPFICSPGETRDFVFFCIPGIGHDQGNQALGNVLQGLEKQKRYHNRHQFAGFSEFRRHEILARRLQLHEQSNSF